MKKDLTKKSSNNNLTKENNIQNNLNKVFDSDQFDSIKNVPNNQSTSSNIKITNNTNIIVNVKSGTKSLDIRALNNNTNKDMMMRDMRELHIITKKAICSISTINPLLDTLDNFLIEFEYFKIVIVLSFSGSSLIIVSGFASILLVLLFLL